MRRTALDLAVSIGVSGAGFVLLSAVLGPPWAAPSAVVWMAAGWWWAALVPLLVLAAAPARPLARMALAVIAASTLLAGLALLLGKSGEDAAALAVTGLVWGGGTVAVAAPLLRMRAPSLALLLGLAATLAPLASPWWVARDRPVPPTVLHANPMAAVVADLGETEWFLAGSLYRQLVDGGGHVHYPRWFETLDCPVALIAVAALWTGVRSALRRRRVRRRRA